jgi:hypothetical protein
VDIGCCGSENDGKLSKFENSKCLQLQPPLDLDTIYHNDRVSAIELPVCDGCGRFCKLMRHAEHHKANKKNNTTRAASTPCRSTEHRKNVEPLLESIIGLIGWLRTRSLRTRTRDLTLRQKSAAEDDHMVSQRFLCCEVHVLLKDAI